MPLKDDKRNPGSDTVPLTRSVQVWVKYLDAWGLSLLELLEVLLVGSSLLLHACLALS